MSRNSAGNHTLPSGNPVVPDTVIESAWANNTMNDLSDSLTDSLDRTGKGGMLAPLLLVDGTEALPGVAFNDDPNSGLYRAAGGDFRYAIQSNDLIRMRPGIFAITYAVDTVDAGPDVIAHRNSPTPAADDLLGRFKLDGENSATEQITYAQMTAKLVDPTDATEDGSLSFWTMQNGVLTEVMLLDENGDVTITNDGDLNVGGDLNVAGNTTIEGSITVTGDVITDSGFDSTTLEGGTATQVLTKNSATDYDYSWVDSGGTGTGLERHRYWRLTDLSGVIGSFRLINSIQVFADGGAFQNGKRWEPGTNVGGLISSVTSDPLPSTPVAGRTVLQLFTRNDPTDSVPAPVTPYLEFIDSPEFVIDFGVNPQALTTVRYGLSGTVVTSHRLEYSDDGTTWTQLASDATDIPAQPDQDWSVYYPFVEQVETYANDGLTDFPDTPGSGGGGTDYWTFDNTIKTGDFNAVLGTYHFFEASGLSGSTVTLPASPSIGDRIGLAHAGFVTSAEKTLTVAVNGNNYYGNAADFDIGFLGTLGSGGDFVTSVELYYINSTVGWVELNRQTKTVPGS